MARLFKKKQKMSPEALARAEKRTQGMLDEMPPSELRTAQLLTQESIAKSEFAKQVEIAQQVMCEDRDASRKLAE
jgi:hypothetical protein